MSRASTSSLTTILAKLKSIDALTWAVLAVIVVYIAIANPQNTPGVFRNPIVRFILFSFVVVVYLLEDPVVGTMFALAMLLPVVYSSVKTNEGFQTEWNVLPDISLPNVSVSEVSSEEDVEDEDTDVPEELSTTPAPNELSVNPSGTSDFPF